MIFYSVCIRISERASIGQFKYQKATNIKGEKKKKSARPLEKLYGFICSEKAKQMPTLKPKLFEQKSTDKGELFSIFDLLITTATNLPQANRYSGLINLNTWEE